MIRLKQADHAVRWQPKPDDSESDAFCPAQKEVYITHKGEHQMSTLEGLKPEKVFHYFEQICQIPHGSGNVEQISNYLSAFAKERGLFCIQDEWKNIIIIKEATPGYEQEEPFILQGHMDMVAVKEPDYEIDMAKEPLRLRAENGRVYAEGTSLGGDDGIAVAYCLALLDSQELAHPRLEIILTVDEEIGMEGAMGIDLSMLRGRRMINLDQEEEGIFITSCAGGAGVDVRIPMRRSAQETDWEANCLMEVKLGGLAGGHSGTEIHKHGGNANVALVQLLKRLTEQTGVMLVSMEGGVADNAIPKESSALIAVKKEQIKQIKALVEEEQMRLKEELSESDPALAITCNMISMEANRECSVQGSKETTAVSGDHAMKCLCCMEDSVKHALSCISMLPNGVVAMSKHVSGLVETSLNLGVMKLTEDALLLKYAVRSSVDQEKEVLCNKMKEIAKQYGAETTVRNVYPGWAYRVDSALRDKMCAVYEKMYGSAPKLEAIHAGLECGILAGKIPGLDCISVGPDLMNVHTAQESMDAASVERVWEYLIAVLSDR